MSDDVNDFGPGLFLGLPDETYHAIPALSASGIKNLLISPMDFWARSWMNPLRDEDADSDARILGRAYHQRILEGAAKFHTHYCAAFEAPDGALKTVEQMKEVLGEAGVACLSKWKRPDYLREVRERVPGAVLYDDVLSAWEEKNDGKTPLSPDTFKRIEIAAVTIERHPHLSKCFKGGFPEVSVVWDDDGVRFKARFDYLKPRAIVDLKSFANQMNKPVDRAIYYAMASNKYHIQAAHYVEAFRKAQEFARAHLADIEALRDSRHVVALSEDQEPSLPWLKEFAACEEPGFYFVFQQKGIAPLARGKKFPRGMMHGAGIASIQDATRRYKECLERFGTDPWIDDSRIDDFEDDEFPVFATEI